MKAPYYCKECGRLDEDGIEGHSTRRCATNKPVATNKAKRLATNRGARATNVKSTATNTKSVAPLPKQASMDAAVSVRTSNRRKKEAYNAYQRDYMRKRRAMKTQPKEGAP